MDGSLTCRWCHLVNCAAGVSEPCEPRKQWTAAEVARALKPAPKNPFEEYAVFDGKPSMPHHYQGIMIRQAISSGHLMSADEALERLYKEG